VGRVVLDAYALIAFLRGEDAGAEVVGLLRRRPPPSISAANLAEVADRLMRIDGRSEVDVRSQVNLLIAGGLEVEPMWLADARLAGSLRARQYDRRSAALSLADCFCLATAIKLQAAVATADPALARASRDEGLEVIPLPDSSGRRP
jgi:PIN domain nuclease of toxin-antitoxin system